MPSVPMLKLCDGNQIPMLGFGTWQSTAEQTRVAMRAALDAGYRHIDTAAIYQNETEIGEVLQEYIKAGKLKREDLFIVTKLAMTQMAPERVPGALADSLKRLKLDYVDMYLIHAPLYTKSDNPFELMPVDANGKLVIDHGTTLEATWKALEPLVNKKLVRSLGISNFNSVQTDKILKIAKIKPVTNQVELHAYHNQEDLRKFSKARNVTLTAFAPIGSPGRPDYLQAKDHPILLQDPVVVGLSKKYNKTPAQILIRSIIQRGIIVIPKSATPSRIKENIDVFGFSLSDADMAAINGLNKNIRFFQHDATANHPEYPYHIPF